MKRYKMILTGVLAFSMGYFKAETTHSYVDVKQLSIRGSADFQCKNIRLDKPLAS